MGDDRTQQQTWCSECMDVEEPFGRRGRAQPECRPSWITEGQQLESAVSKRSRRLTAREIERVKGRRAVNAKIAKVGAWRRADVRR